MGEIQIGEYIRTKKGRIYKLIKIDKTIITVGHGMQEIKSYAKFSKYHSIYADNYQELYEKINKNITKHSKNIIDLIEEGDIVNNKLVLQVDYKSKNICLLIPLSDTKANTNIMWYGYEEIKTILTKEQYENNCYEVGE